MLKIKTPTLDKISEARPMTQAIGEFLEWLQSEQKIVLAREVSAAWVCDECGALDPEEATSTARNHGVCFNGFFTDGPKWSHRRCGKEVEHVPGGLRPAYMTIEDLLRRFVGVDPVAEEKERRAILDWTLGGDGAFVRWHVLGGLYAYRRTTYQHWSSHYVERRVEVGFGWSGPGGGSSPDRSVGFARRTNIFS